MKEIIDRIVTRFLGWKLPEDFNPDAGISFVRDFNVGTPYPMKHEPVGTNLFNAVRAEAMVRHIAGEEIESLQAKVAELQAALEVEREKFAKCNEERIRYRQERDNAIDMHEGAYNRWHIAEQQLAEVEKVRDALSQQLAEVTAERDEMRELNARQTDLVRVETSSKVEQRERADKAEKRAAELQAAIDGMEPVGEVKHWNIGGSGFFATFQDMTGHQILELINDGTKLYRKPEVQ